LFSNVLSGAGLMGMHVGGWAGVSLLGAAGVHSYWGFGATQGLRLFGGDPGATATVPFVGARIGLNFPLQTWADGLVGLEVMGLWDADFAQTVHYSYVDSGIFSSREVAVDRQVGQSSFGLLLSVTIGFGHRALTPSPPTDVVADAHL
jgi:hypothetical protein